MNDMSILPERIFSKKKKKKKRTKNWQEYKDRVLSYMWGVDDCFELNETLILHEWVLVIVKNKIKKKKQKWFPLSMWYRREEQVWTLNFCRFILEK